MVGLPAGARLLAAKNATNTVNVEQDGVVIAVIAAPLASDAEGTPVPLSMSVSGRTIVLHVDQTAGSYRYPIVVDPTATVIDSTLEAGEAGWSSNWEVEHSTGVTMYASDGTLIDAGPGEKGDWGLWGYETHGKSHIYEFTSETSAAPAAELENFLVMVRPPGVEERSAHLPSSYGTTPTKLCTITPSCEPGTVESGPGNLAYFKQVDVGPAGGGLHSFNTVMSKASVYILQEQGPTAAFNTSAPEIDNQPNVLYTHGWLTESSGAFGASGSDPGIGLDEVAWRSPQSSEYGRTEVKKCVQCATTASFTSLTSNLPNGEDKIEYTLKDAAGLAHTATAMVKVDTAPPGEIELAGLPPNDEIGNGVYHLKASAKDGSGTALSSGVESLVLKIDGKQFGSPGGSCSPGPCTDTAEWAITGTEFATGQHEVTVTATDKAGNVATEKFTMYVARPTTPIAIGPGTVDPQSGEFRLSATDVSITAPGGSLSISRSFGSLHTTAGAEGPLGPQWSLSLGGSQNLTKLPDGDMLLTDGTGLQAVFASAGGGAFTAPTGDEGLVLTEKTVEGKVEFQLKDKTGSVTTFTPSAVGEGNAWLPTVREQAGGLDITTVSYQTVGSITEPTQILAPKPAGVASCSPLVEGCRALGFVYASTTTATGEQQSQWGDYQGHLKEVTFTAWEPAAGKMVTKAVAQYQYDAAGKLRAEWNPQVSPTLKTIYGYDSSGRVTAVTAPGQQPWILTYGAIVNDARSGRLLAATRPSVSTAFGNGVAPANTALPTISPAPVVGEVTRVANGTWSNSPLSYAYQWEACVWDPSENCTPILEATNQSYVPTVEQKNAELRVRVTATDAAGSTSVLTADTGYPKSQALTTFASNSGFGKEGTAEGQLKSPDGITFDSKGNVWVADTGNDRIEEFSAGGSFLKAYGKEGSGNVEF